MGIGVATPEVMQILNWDLHNIPYSDDSIYSKPSPYSKAVEDGHLKCVPLDPECGEFSLVVHVPRETLRIYKKSKELNEWMPYGKIQDGLVVGTPVHIFVAC